MIKMLTFKQFLLNLFEAEISPIKVVFLESAKEEYKNFKSIAGVQDNLQEFFRCKKKFPQEKLKASFKEHALQGGIFKKQSILECHLSADVLLLYAFKNHTLYIIGVCSHDFLKKSSKLYLKRISDFLSN